ncbi:histidine kinase N-terminal 7TM domain-containing diguanylate cyclase [Kineococcus sp. G2]|uniref:histidine kinase N-terminal 7TM domain-containing diguanylate cyclase n=1 Tax=Kineococcus sp. G2 TaxID=3127484 RepID=UPI00301B8B4B
MTPVLALAFACSALVCVLTAALAWRRRANTPAAGSLAAAMAGFAVWSAADVPLHLPVGLLVQRVGGMVGFAGIHLAVLGLWCLSRAVVDRHWRLRRGVALRLATASTLLVAAVVTNPWHHLVFASVGATGPDQRLDVSLGPLFWVHTGYCYLLLGWGVLRLTTAWWRARSVFRRQLSHLLAAACVPLIGNAAVLVAARGEHPVDYTPLFFAVTGLIDARAILRHDLLHLVPVARARVVDSIDDAVVVVDHRARVIDLNPAASVLLARNAPAGHSDLVGRPAAQVLPPQLGDLLRGTAVREHAELAAGVHVDARASVLTDPRGHLLGWVVVLRDVSELVEQRELAQRASARLREQLAVTRALQERLAEEAVRDSLTGLHNRRHLVQVLERALAGARESGEPLSVVLVDIDRFKAVNDTHGHRTGDAVLRAVAEGLRAGCRAGDTVARYGGEEFVLVLPSTSREEAFQRTEELRRRCAAATVRLPGPVPHPREAAWIAVTFSAGIATCAEHGTDADGLLAAADRALYAAKAAGRDRVVAAP